MQALKATEQSQDSRGQFNSSSNLDDRYGKIGISAVAAAVHHQGELRNASDAHAVYEFDAD